MGIFSSRGINTKPSTQVQPDSTQPAHISDTASNAYIVSNQAAIERAYWRGDYGDPRSAQAKAEYTRLMADVLEIARGL